MQKEKKVKKTKNKIKAIWKKKKKNYGLGRDAFPVVARALIHTRDHCFEVFLWGPLYGVLMGILGHLLALRRSSELSIHLPLLCFAVAPLPVKPSSVYHCLPEVSLLPFCGSAPQKSCHYY